MANQRLERMLTGIKRAETVDTQQGGKEQRLKALQDCRLAMMQQGKVIVRVRLLIGLDRLRELGHHRGKGLLVVEPMGKQMHAHTRHMGCDPDDLCATGHRPVALSTTRAALTTIEPRAARHRLT